MGALEIICMASAGMLSISWDCGRPGPIPNGPIPCPRFNWKDLPILIVAVLGAFIYLSILPDLKNPLTSTDVIASIVVGVAFGRFIKKILCPIPIK